MASKAALALILVFACIAGSSSKPAGSEDSSYVMAIRNLDADNFQCGHLICPENTVKCAILLKINENDSSKSETIRRCLDDNGHTLLEGKTTGRSRGLGDNISEIVDNGCSL